MFHACGKTVLQAVAFVPNASLAPRAVSSQLWLERLEFRNRLRRDPDLASEYAELKSILAAKFKLDREAYTDAKAPFVQRVLAQSR